MNACCPSCRWRLLLPLLLLLGAPQPAAAVEWDGEGRSSNWLDALNWEFNQIPTTGDTATIVHDTATITGVSVPPVLGLEVGESARPGGLVMSGAGNAAMLEVLSETTIAGGGTLAVGGSTAHLFSSLVRNSGAVTVSTGGQITTFQQYVQAEGTTELRGGQINAPAMQIEAGLLRGSGQIDGDVTLGGVSRSARPVLSPGIDVGTLEIDGDLQLRSGAELFIEIDTSALTPRADLLQVSGLASLGGRLNLSLLGEGTIGPSQRLEFLIAGELEPGTFFHEITGLATKQGSLIVTFDPSATNPLSFTVGVHETQIKGDMNGDQVVDALDANLFAWALRDTNSYRETFINALGKNGLPVEVPCQIDHCGAADEQIADMDFDNARTFADIPLFLDEVAISGGNVTAAWDQIAAVLGQSVPEPATLWLALAALAALGTCRGGARSVARVP